jgi:hypothetical protein
MNTVIARAVLTLGLVALPASALASTKTGTQHAHSVAKKDVAPKKKGKHHSHKSTGSKAVAAAPSKTSIATKAAAATPALADSAPKAP